MLTCPAYNVQLGTRKLTAKTCEDLAVDVLNNSTKQDDDRYSLPCSLPSSINQPHRGSPPAAKS